MADSAVTECKRTIFCCDRNSCCAAQRQPLSSASVFTSMRLALRVDRYQQQRRSKEDGVARGSQGSLFECPTAHERQRNLKVYFLPHPLYTTLRSCSATLPFRPTTGLGSIPHGCHVATTTTAACCQSKSFRLHTWPDPNALAEPSMQHLALASHGSPTFFAWPLLC